jgi:UDP-N-acetylmuramyl pentapeptide synthase
MTPQLKMQSTAGCSCSIQGHENKQIAERMLMLSPVAMRLELKEGINNCSVINDSYNSDLGSLAIALDFLEQQKQHPKKTVILSDILQSGKNEEALYKEVAELLERETRESPDWNWRSHFTSKGFIQRGERSFIPAPRSF